MTYKEKVLKRLNEDINIATLTVERTSQRGEIAVYTINDLTATFSSGKIKLIIRFKGVEVPLESEEEALDLFKVFIEKHKEFEDNHIAITLEEL